MYKKKEKKQTRRIGGGGMIMSGWIQIIPKLTPHSNGVEEV